MANLPVAWQRDATAAIINIVCGAGEFVDCSLHAVAGYAADKTERYGGRCTSFPRCRRSD